MSSWQFRFVHAADLHLEMPPSGVAEVPEHLRDLFLQSAYLAAERVFETALVEGAEFLVLSGDVLDPRRTGPRGLVFLLDQFRRMAERSVAVYWAGGRVDPPDAWPAAMRLPENVHVFPLGRAAEYVHHRGGVPLARVAGASSEQGDRDRTIRPADFDADPAEAFSIAVVHGTGDPESMGRRGIHYWALGGRHARHTFFSSPHVAHDPGSPQGRHPGETGPHGCTLVEVDAERRIRTTLVPTDVMRWENPQITVQPTTTRSELEGLLQERMQRLLESSAGRDLLVSWTLTGSGPLLEGLRRGPLAGELLDGLRRRYGYGPPAAWSLSLLAQPTAALPPEWYEQDTIRGDYLRLLRQYQTASSEPLGLEAYLAEPQRAGALAAAAEVSDPAVRERVLCEAALLGVDLLSGEEPQP